MIGAFGKTTELGNIAIEQALMTRSGAPVAF
jgi:hypothetical protein